MRASPDLLLSSAKPPERQGEQLQTLEEALLGTVSHVHPTLPVATAEPRVTSGPPDGPAWSPAPEDGKQAHCLQETRDSCPRLCAGRQLHPLCLLGWMSRQGSCVSPED